MDPKEEKKIVTKEEEKKKFEEKKVPTEANCDYEQLLWLVP